MNISTKRASHQGRKPLRLRLRLSSAERPQGRPKFFIGFFIFVFVFSMVAQGLPLTVSALTIPANKVDISMFGFVMNNSSAYSVINDQPTGIGELKNGNVGKYPESSCVPLEIEVKNKDNQTGDIVVSPVYDYFNSVTGVDDLKKITTSLSGNPKSSADNLNDFLFSGQSLTAATTFSLSSGGTVGATINGPFSGSTSGTSAITSTDASRHYNITLSNVPAGATAYILLCSKLGLDSSLYNGGAGATLSVRTAQGGNENVPIPVNQILELPSITLTKIVQGGTATPDQWSFNVSPAINEQTNYSIPSGQGSVTIPNVSPDGTYSITESGPSDYNFLTGAGTSCTFSGFTASGTVSAGKPATSASCTFTNTFISATPTHSLVISTDGNGLGSVNGGTSETYDEGTSFSLTAVNDIGSVFSGWSGGICNGIGGCSFNLNSDSTITATFNLIKETLLASVAGNGTVTSDPSGINCESDCTEDYDYDTSVDLMANPADGWAFDGWSGDCTDNNSLCSILMNAEKSVSALFTEILPDQFLLSIAVSGNGSVSSNDGDIDCPNNDCNQNYDENTVVTLTATEDLNNTFTSWDNCDQASDNVCTVTMDQSENVTANFAPITHTLNTVIVSGDGTVTSNIGDIDCGSTCSDTYNQGSIVELSASPDDGWAFDGWSGACSDTDTCEVTINADTTVNATFSKFGTWDVRKVVNGGTAAISSFAFLINGTGTPIPFSDTVDGLVQIPVPPDALVYVTEAPHAGYTSTLSAGCGTAETPIAVATDSHADCTITNNYNESNSDVTPPQSTFDNVRSHQIINTELISLSLTGSSVDFPTVGGSGVASAKMTIYQLASAETMSGAGFFNRPSEEELSPFESLSCDPLSQGAVEIELVQLNLVSTAPLTVTWDYKNKLNSENNSEWTVPGRGVYCAIVHATDVADNLENTGTAGPFAYNPTPPPSTPTPTPTPSPTPEPTPAPNGGGGGGGGGSGSSGVFLNGPLANPPAVAGASIIAPPQVAGAMTVLPATGASLFDRMLFSLFTAMFMTGALMLLAGYEILPRRILRKIR